MRAHFVGYVESLFRQAEPLAGSFGKLCAAFTVTGCSAFDFWDALADSGLGDDDLGLTVIVGFSLGDSVVNRSEIMTVDGHSVPTLRSEVGLRVLALSLVGHRVESDIVGIVDQD